MSAAAALVVAGALAGCGSTTYFAGRNLPPSGLTNRVLIAIQNPGAAVPGALSFVDAYYDIRYKYNSTNSNPAFVLSGFGGHQPISIQNVPEERYGVVYSAGDGSLVPVNYSSEVLDPKVLGLNGLSSSVFMTRNQSFVFAANQETHVLTVINNVTGASYPLNLPGVYRVSVNPGGSVALAFAQNSNYIYYPRQLSSAQTIAYSGGPTTWPANATDCEPQNGPLWCLFQAVDPVSGKALAFDRPTKAVFSADGGTAYVLNCGPECGGTTASVSPLPVAPLIYIVGEQSGVLPTQSALNASSIAIPGGASNALVDSSTMYVVGQCAAAPTLTASQQPQCAATGKQTATSLYTGMLTVVTLPTATTPIAATAPLSISDGEPGAVSRMILADDDTLWIGMSKCANSVRASNNLPYGCLTMVNVATPTSPVATLLPYVGDATGIAAVTGLHKVYTAEGGQVYIYSTVDGSSINNSNVTVTGTAYDVAYMDATTDDDNTVY
jgi:hypothetical protein